MAAPVYATRAELVASEYLPGTVTVPDDPEATRLLTRASRRIDRLLLTAVYDVDEDEAPTDADVIAALRAATCAQAAWWLEHGDESGAGAEYDSVSIGSVALSGRRAGASSAGASAAPAALEVLTLAGLVGTGPAVAR